MDYTISFKEKRALSINDFEPRPIKSRSELKGKDYTAYNDFGYNNTYTGDDYQKIKIKVRAKVKQ